MKSERDQKKQRDLQKLCTQAPRLMGTLRWSRAGPSRVFFHPSVGSCLLPIRDVPSSTAGSRDEQDVEAERVPRERGKFHHLLKERTLASFRAVA